MFFSGYLIEPNPSPSSLPNGLALQRSNSLTSLNSTIGADETASRKDKGNNEEYLRICLSCQKVLQRRYDQICFKNAQRDDIFIHYDVSYLHNIHNFFVLFSFIENC